MIQATLYLERHTDVEIYYQLKKAILFRKTPDKIVATYGSETMIEPYYIRASIVLL